MKNLFFVPIFFLVFTGCATLFPTRQIEASLAKATAQKWIMGARDAGRGVTFQLKFYNTKQAFTTDTLWANTVPMTTELTRVGDTTFVTSFYTTLAENQPVLINESVFEGKLNIYVDGKKHKLPIKTFAQLPLAVYP